MRRWVFYPGLVAATVAMLLMGGCIYSPSKYKPPVAPQLTQNDSWNTKPAGGETASPADDATLSQWWSVFGDPELASLEERALKSNLDLRTAQIAIVEAQASVESSKGNLYPTVGANVGTSYTRSGGGGGGGSFVSNGMTVSGQNNWSLQANYTPDLYGGVRMGVAASEATLESRQESLRNTMVTLTQQLALDYVDVRSFQAQLATTNDNLVRYKETYDMTVAKRDAGLASALDAEQARQTVVSTESQIPSLENSLQQSRNAISILLGKKPGEVDAELAETKPVPKPPASVAVGIPADLIRRRPDIRVAERQYAAQWMQVGVAEANRWPTFSLGGSITANAISFGNLVTTAASVAEGVSGSLQATILNRKALNAQVHAQKATLDQTEVSYESTVLNAIQDVENALKAYSTEQERRKSLAEAVVIAENEAEMSRTLYDAGQKDFLTVLDAERTELSAESSLVQSDANIAEDLIRLYKAMGGGWK
jgi:NodT family efflux transporter outer membrane factor (OMF) lipoprotein